MARLEPFTDLIERTRGLSRGGFLAEVTEPYLLFSGAESDELPTLFRTLVSGGSTVTGDTPCLGLRPQKILEALGAQWVVALRKEPGANAFGMMITVGRAENNDVVIPDRRVSKFHLYFRQEGGAWIASDAGSTNGTAIDDVELERGQRAHLRSGSLVELAGSLRLTFLLPEDLYELAQFSDATAVRASA